MASNRSYSIYERIVIIVSIPILLLTCLLLGVYRVFYNMSMAQAKENFVLQTEQCTASFDQQFDAIASLAQSVGYSEVVQRYFAQMTSQERVSNYKSVRQLFSTASKTAPGIIAIYVGNNDGAFVESGNGNLRYFQLAYMARNLWAGEQKQAWFTDMFQIENSDSPRYCIYYAPIGIITPISLMNEADVLTCGVLIDAGQLFGETSSSNPSLAEVLFDQGKVVASSAAMAPEQTQALEHAAAYGGMDGDALLSIG